jgi:dihydroorotase/N-acyl-D-amino-acid deacylase
LKRIQPILLFCLLAAGSIACAQQYDVLIRNGRLVDGSGNPWTYADVGVIGDRIAFVGRAAEGVTAKRTIDATGLVVAPGFIDMLGQSELNLLVDKQGVSKLTHGVTTEITGEGDSIAPTDEKLAAENADVLQHYKITQDWRSLEEYFQCLAKQGSALNLGTYVGAAQVRRLVIGTANREPTAAELKDMEIAVDDAMSDGAMGVSSALIYAPGNYAKIRRAHCPSESRSSQGWRLCLSHP